MTIGKLAETAGVTVETIRFYERRGLITEPPRRSSGYRIYSPDYVSRIRFIKRAQEIGYTLKEVEELLLLRVDENTSCVEVRQQAEAKIVDLEEKIRDLKRVRKALVALAATCTGRGPITECPILDALEHDP